MVPDPRDPRGVRHPLPAILAVGLAAVLAGARSFTVIGEWVSRASEDVLSGLGVTGTARPTESTIRRVFARIDADHLDRVLAAWMWTRIGVIQGRRVIAIDNKTVRGAKIRGGTAPHLVAVLDHALGVVLGQLAVAAKSNEIPCVRTLLGLFDLVNTVVTLDAMHTQTDTARAIISRGGDYVLTVKKNQPGLYRDCKNLPWNQVPAHSVLTSRRGRRARRTIKVVTAPAWVTFAGAAQIAQLRRTVTKNGKKTVEVVYVITSADHTSAPPATLAAWVQGHWGVENRLHWIRDVTFDEDRSQVRTGNAPQVIATLRNTAISLLRLAGETSIAKALRHQAADPTRALKLLMTC
ncbi:MAG: ISAs1 family transposase [Dermatophilaceae bacterium]